MRNSLPIFLSAAIAAITVACTGKNAEVWTTTKATPVYAAHSDTEQQVSFTLAPGDTCILLRSVVMKAYLHTEIQCEKGRGWVIDEQNFDIRKID